EDVSQVTREFAAQANADMGGKGIWWLNGLCGESNDFTGQVYDYQPVWGTGAALVKLTPNQKNSLKLSTEQFGSQKVISSSAPEPVGAYPHARKEGDLIYLSGIGP